MKCLSLSVLFLLAAPVVHAADLVVFAAASLKEPLDKLAAQMGDTVVSYSGSGTLARQIMQGAPADVVVLAHPDWMQMLDDSGDIAADSRVDLLGNTLVLVAPVGTDAVALTPDALTVALGDGRLAMGLSGSVPAGIYGKQALEALGLWGAVQGHLAEVDSVRAALALVARAETPLGITYATDALAAPAVTVVATFPADSHEPIVYQAAAVADGDPRSADFLTLLSGPIGQKVFSDAGFVPLSQP